MYWKCPGCGSLFIDKRAAHECAADEQFTIRGELPDGEPLPKGARAERERAVQQDVPVAEALVIAFHLVLSATGMRDGFECDIDPSSFRKAIRRFRPASKFPGRITEMDDKMYACRVAHRLLNQAFGQQLNFAGGYGSEAATDQRARAIYEWIRERAALEKIHPHTGASTAT
ncbi:hypothetical protein [Anaeromyxobacter diazotrophicus]|uniref:Uncharacterized protein n=1 Tax=Anaeromyxobacter diazotrophicus TaxID=2590199 RepID=A0A7I9VKI2_9BACT|nr:hypothetical protein [Anaeromyxobacter diazotrophicus]GEJ56660.1 hypothetical protein AMYX_14010 [Anaeromyxobacter diazotrophicus]